MLLRTGVRPCGDSAIFEDLGAGGCREVGAVLHRDDEGLLCGAIVFAMLGCDGDVR